DIFYRFHEQQIFFQAELVQNVADLRRKLVVNARRNHTFASSITILQDETTPSPARTQYCTIKPRLLQLSNHAFASSNTILHDQTTPSLARTQYYTIKPRLS